MLFRSLYILLFLLIFPIKHKNTTNSAKGKVKTPKETFSTGCSPSYRTGFKLLKLKSGIDKKVTVIIIKRNIGGKIAIDLPRSSMPPLTAHITRIVEENASTQTGVSDNEIIRTNSIKSLIISAVKRKAYDININESILPNTFPKRVFNIS